MDPASPQTVTNIVNTRTGEAFQNRAVALSVSRRKGRFKEGEAALAITVYLPWPFAGPLCSGLGSSVPTLPNERFARSYKSRTDS